MFRSIRDDFDPRYWTRASVSLLVLAFAGSGGGVAWLLYELLSRIGWFLIQILLSWLFPPAFTMAILPAEPITHVLIEKVGHRAVADTIVPVELDTDMGSFDAEFPPDPVFDVADLPPDPAELERVALDRRIAENAGVLGVLRAESESVGLLGMLSSSGGGGDSISNVFGSSGFDSELTGGIGGLIGAKGTQIGAGGLGSRGSGLGGGGTAEGLGGLGTKGIGSGKSGYGRGVGLSNTSGTTVAKGAPVSLGSLDKTAMQSVIKRHMRQIQYCYERELSKSPTLAGKVVIKFAVAEDGTVSSASVKSSTMNNAPVENCIVGRFMRMRFPKSEGVSIVSYPFIFRAK